MGAVVRKPGTWAVRTGHLIETTQKHSEVLSTAVGAVGGVDAARAFVF